MENQVQYDKYVRTFKEMLKNVKDIEKNHEEDNFYNGVSYGIYIALKNVEKCLSSASKEEISDEAYEECTNILNKIKKVIM